MSTILWHPHQGLWNTRLLRTIRVWLPIAILRKAVVVAIVLLDTCLLFFRALARRTAAVGIKRLFVKPNIPSGIGIVYFDLGTHRSAEELELMIDVVLPKLGAAFTAYGFEASTESVKVVQSKFDMRNDVTVIHAALCYNVPPEGKVRLYKDDSEGIGDSLYRKGADYIEVDAMRLSSWIQENGIDLQENLCLLRMNIEGAEYDVIRDLVESGQADRIDGYYGMWDDLSKIDPVRDSEFREYLAKHAINSFTFNKRDLKVPLRSNIIAYDIETSVLRALGGAKTLDRDA